MWFPKPNKGCWELFFSGRRNSNKQRDGRLMSRQRAPPRGLPPEKDSQLCFYCITVKKTSCSRWTNCSDWLWLIIRKPASLWRDRKWETAPSLRFCRSDSVSPSVTEVRWSAWGCCSLVQLWRCQRTAAGLHQAPLCLQTQLPLLWPAVTSGTFRKLPDRFSLLSLFWESSDLLPHPELLTTTRNPWKRRLRAKFCLLKTFKNQNVRVQKSQADVPAALRLQRNTELQNRENLHRRSRRSRTKQKKMDSEDGISSGQSSWSNSQKETSGLTDPWRVPCWATRRQKDIWTVHETSKLMRHKRISLEGDNSIVNVKSWRCWNW